jgi:hypothetical protein
MRVAMTQSNVKAATLLLFVLAACGGEESREESSLEEMSPVTAIDSSWTVTPKNFGPLRFGMSVDLASTAVPGGFAKPPAATGCDYANPAKGPPGVMFMVENGTVVRIDVDSATIKTAEGAGVGETEARLRELYGSRIEVQPHKYEQGHSYFIVRPTAAADSAFRIIFETDGSKVMRYRAGLRPAVEYVERCG